MDSCCVLSDLPDDVQRLCRESLKVREYAYCPYSHFKVGAAILCPDGQIFSGCNVENAAYPVGICAERSASVKAVSEGHTDFLKAAVGAKADDDSFVTPCGECRQFLCEFNPEIPIYLVRPNEEVHCTNLKLLLPHSFSPKNIKLSFAKKQ